tara:strand:- start:1167 stop:2243 length:1077 start_codon:yes stop_codon:yes gene_type:complete
MNNKIDFVWSSKKEYNALEPLFLYFISQKKVKVNFIKIHKNRLVNYVSLPKISYYVVISHSHTYYRLKKYGWKGEFIYVDHGISPIKYYSYIYDFFYKSSLLFYPGEIFKRKMDYITNKKFDKGLLGGFPIADDLFNTKINKQNLINKYKLKENKPIILFAPTWGSKKNKLWGLNNLKHLNTIDNIIVVPHPSDYTFSKIFKNIIIPKDRKELNNILHLSDIIISDISSILLEGTLINKNTIQLILEEYPGTFPLIDLNDNNISLPKNILKNEINNSNLKKRPFKISFIDQDMVVDFTSKLTELSKTIEEVLKHPNKNLNSRNYWGKECCWKFDGKTNERIYKMIINFIENKEIKQLN